MKASGRSGFAKWLCSRRNDGDFDPICDLAYDWKRDSRAPKHVKTLEEIIGYLRSANACREAIEIAEIAFWIYNADNKKRNVSPTLRFEILHRDKFTCQYCGRKAPDVQLAVDHIVPFSRGGTCTKDNLTTACVDCNTGKSDMMIGGL